MKFTEGKLCKMPQFSFELLKKQRTIQGSTEGHKGNTFFFINHSTGSHCVTVTVSIACMVSAKHFLVPLM